MTRIDTPVESLLDHTKQLWEKWRSRDTTGRIVAAREVVDNVEHLMPYAPATSAVTTRIEQLLRTWDHTQTVPDHVADEICADVPYLLAAIESDTTPIAHEAALAALIRKVDGRHTLGAAELAEALVAEGVSAPTLQPLSTAPVPLPSLAQVVAAHAVDRVDVRGQAICLCGGVFHDDTSDTEPKEGEITHSQHLADQLLTTSTLGAFVSDIIATAHRWQSATVPSMFDDDPDRPDIVTRSFGIHLAAILAAHDITVPSLDPEDDQ